MIAAALVSQYCSTRQRQTRASAPCALHSTLCKGITRISKTHSTHSRTPHPKSSPHKPRSSPGASTKSNPSPLSCARRTRHPQPIVWNCYVCNPHSTLRLPYRPMSCGTKQKRQAGLCCVPSSGARRNIRVNSRRRMRAQRLGSARCANVTLLLSAPWGEPRPRAPRVFCRRATRDRRTPRDRGRSRACGARSMVSVFLLIFFTLLTRTSWLRARNAVPETPSATPVSITQSLPALRLEHTHLLGEHGADRVALRQCEAELADAQARNCRHSPPGHSCCGGPCCEG
jgi:hypothetical protein